MQGVRELEGAGNSPAAAAAGQAASWLTSYCAHARACVCLEGRHDMAATPVQALFVRLMPAALSTRPSLAWRLPPSTPTFAPTFAHPPPSPGG